MKKIIPVLIALWCVHAASALEADESFASHLFEKGEYRWALVEYERLLFAFPDSSSVGHWNFLTGMCNLKERRFLPALQGFRRAIADTTIADSASLYAATCAVELRALDSAQNYLTRCSLAEGRILAGYIDFCKNDFPAAVTHLRLVADSSSISFKARSFEQIVSDASAFSEKHYAPALLLSVIPGLGHVYTRRYGDGLMTALTIATGAGITGYYAWHKARPQAYTAGIITGLFYAGGIYGAAVSVKIYNKESRQKFRVRAERIVFDR